MKQPRIGFSTMLGSNVLGDLPDQLDMIAGLGADMAELSALHDDLIAKHRLIPSRMAMLKSIIADRPLDYSVHAAIGPKFYGALKSATGAYRCGKGLYRIDGRMWGTEYGAAHGHVSRHLEPDGNKGTL